MAQARKIEEHVVLGQRKAKNMPPTSQLPLLSPFRGAAGALTGAGGQSNGFMQS